MANIRDIKTRIQSIKNTRQITNAMKMVSTSKLRKSKDRIISARPYANIINDILKNIKERNKMLQMSIFDDVKAPKKRVLVVVTSDRGLCGAFNANIIKQAVLAIEEDPNVDLVCIGKKGFDYLKKRTDRIVEKYVGFFNEMNFGVSSEIADILLDMFLTQAYDSIEVLYNEFVSVIQQDIVHKKLFPIEIEKSETNMVDYIYEPDEETIIEELVAKYIRVEIWRIMLESSAAEQGARMTAMDSATDNASELINELTLHYNRARQAAITKEIIEISSGAEALK